MKLQDVDGTETVIIFGPTVKLILDTAVCRPS